MSRMVSIAADGDAVAVPCHLLSVTLTAGEAAATLAVSDGSGDTFLTLGCAIGESVIWRARDKDGIRILDSITVDISGTASIEYR